VARKLSQTYRDHDSPDSRHEKLDTQQGPSMEKYTKHHQTTNSALNDKYGCEAAAYWDVMQC